MSITLINELYVFTIAHVFFSIILLRLYVKNIREKEYLLVLIGLLLIQFIATECSQYE